MPTDFTAARLLKAFHSASNQAQGAEMLLTHLLALDSPARLPVDVLARARAYCDQLGEVTAAAQKACQAHVAPPFDAAAYEAQQRITGHLQNAA
jgi:hypothetical protein